MSISAGLRSKLAHLGDALITGDEELPSASGAGVHAELLDQVLLSRADLERPLVEALTRLPDDLTPGEAVTALRRRPTDFEVVSTVLAGAYLMSPQVRGTLGYPGQEPKRVDPFDYVRVIEDGLLDPVVERGPIYRPTPDA
jgi:hypothetical protein